MARYGVAGGLRPHSDRAGQPPGEPLGGARRSLPLSKRPTKTCSSPTPRRGPIRPRRAPTTRKTAGTAPSSRPRCSPSTPNRFRRRLKTGSIIAAPSLRLRRYFWRSFWASFCCAAFGATPAATTAKKAWTRRSSRPSRAPRRTVAAGQSLRGARAPALLLLFWAAATALLTRASGTQMRWSYNLMCADSARAPARPRSSRWARRSPATFGAARG